MADEQQNLGENVKEGVDNFFTSTQRILTVSKKPDANQYWMMVRVTGVGIAIIGLLGFAIELINFFVRAALA